MKTSVKPLKYLIPGAGALGALLRTILYTTGTDEQGLLVTGHWAGIALWTLTALIAVVLVLACRNIQGPEQYRDCYPVSAFSAAGSILCAVGFLISGISGWSAAASGLDFAVVILSLLSAAALAYVAFCRLTRRKPLSLCHGVVCVCFALRMVCQYREWSSDPQLQDYCFYMLAHVGLMLTAFHMAAFDAGMGRHRTLWLTGLTSCYFCLLCLWGSRDPLFMALSGLWALTGLTSLTARPRRVRPALKLKDEPQEEA